MDEQKILCRLVALNVERTKEEREGRVRWLRPEYQCREKQSPPTPLTLGAFAPVARKKGKKAPRITEPWPGDLPGQVQGVRQALTSLGGAASLESVAQCFARALRALVGDVLASLEAEGIVELRDGGIWTLL